MAADIPRRLCHLQRPAVPRRPAVGGCPASRDGSDAEPRNGGRTARPHRCPSRERHPRHRPLARHPAQHGQARGILIHRSDQSRAQFLTPFKLPRTRVEDTVLDLVAVAPTFDHAYTWIARAVSRKLVSVAALRAALAARRRVRWRVWLDDALEDAADGIYSSLERRYVRDVERSHGLPRSQHQARRRLNGKIQSRDNWYPDYHVAVEIDGPAYHQNERVQLDKDRDNRNLALDDVKTHRFGPVDVTEHACQAAALVAATLQRNGWRGAPRPCRRPNCAVRSPETRPRRR